MLLRHTPKEINERSAVTINPAKTCQPIGAMYAALGIHGCLPHSHGSQGCCAYHRSALTRHYKEPVSAATSSFTEGSSVFGGQANLLQAINNIFTVYNPEVIAVHTTCLSETIGDDLNQIFDKAQKEGTVPPGKTLVGASTPSYVGSHVTGFSNMVKAMADLAEPTGKKTARSTSSPAGLNRRTWKRSSGWPQWSVQISPSSPTPPVCSMARFPASTVCFPRAVSPLPS
jgi:nitrogenase molybdenum-iron protein beta chain